MHSAARSARALCKSSTARFRTAVSGAGPRARVNGRTGGGEIRAPALRARRWLHPQHPEPEDGPHRPSSAHAQPDGTNPDQRRRDGGLHANPTHPRTQCHRRGMPRMWHARGPARVSMLFSDQRMACVRPLRHLRRMLQVLATRGIRRLACVFALSAMAVSEGFVLSVGLGAGARTPLPCGRQGPLAAARRGRHAEALRMRGGCVRVWCMWRQGC